MGNDSTLSHADYDVLHSRGDPISASRPYYIYLYPNNNSVDNEINNALANAAEHFCEQMWDESIIDFYEVSRWTSGPLYLSQDSKWDARESMRTYIYNNNIKFKGTHMLVTDAFVGGAAETCQTSNSTAFVKDKAATMGIQGAKEQYQNTLIHEACHTIVGRWLSDNRELWYYMEDTGEYEHILGRTYGQSYNANSTPMITGYEPQYNSDGVCQGQHDNVFYQKGVTDCTAEAILNTANEEM
ncbi:hypothetical protein [Haloarchaeobius baliensis]|jgi:hypothetical protein|uniref:hypothetical protein n=1 Tax=Haloarchaeobius baliensis TaxID=1670458 RepID=UPI003F881673